MGHDRASSSGHCHGAPQASPSVHPDGWLMEAGTRPRHDTGGGVWKFAFPNELQLGASSQHATSESSGDDNMVVPHTPPSARRGGGSQECGKDIQLVENDGGELLLDAGIKAGNSEVLGSAPSEGIKSSLEGTVHRSLIKEVGHRMNKVVASSAAGRDDGVAAQSAVVHAKAVCMRKHRIRFKGMTCCGGLHAAGT